jgi:hypothetical protein
LWLLDSGEALQDPAERFASAAELGQVTTPFYAIGQLKSARAGYLRIRGFHTALESCTDAHGPWDWNYKERGFEHLCAEVEAGQWVLVLDPTWPPISPAYRQVNGQWEVARNVWSATFRNRFAARAQTLEREQCELGALQSRNQSSSVAPETEPATGPGHRAATLGPHVGGNESESFANKAKGEQDGQAIPASNKGFPVSDQEAEQTFAQALADQKAMLESKKSELDRWDTEAQANFKTWFGTASEADRDVVRNRIDATLELNKNYDINKFQPASPKNRDAYAYVNPNDPEHRIYLGDPFWSAPATGADSKAGILSHEMSHFNDVGGTDDFAYGAGDAKQLAKDDPAQALNNADNFEFYLENAK